MVHDQELDIAKMSHEKVMSFLRGGLMCEHQLLFLSLNHPEYLANVKRVIDSGELKQEYLGSESWLLLSAAIELHDAGKDVSLDLALDALKQKGILLIDGGANLNRFLKWASEREPRSPERCILMLKQANLLKVQITR